MLDRNEVHALARGWLAHVGADDALKILTSDAPAPAGLIDFCGRVLQMMEVEAPTAEEAEGPAKGDAR
jgi:hypothetical protein